MIDKVRTGLIRWTVRLFFSDIASDLPVEKQRQALKRLSYILKFTVPKSAQFSKASIPGIKANWVEYESQDKERLIIYFHGGGFITGSPESHLELTARISHKANTRLLSVDYRLAPEHVYPAAQDDCLNAYLWALDAGYRAENIVLGGDSAGGFFTLQTLLSIKAKGLMQPRAAFCLSPLTDAIHFNGDSYATRFECDPWLKPKNISRLVDLYMGENQSKPDTFCARTSDLSGLPPLLVHVGDQEVLLNDSLDLVARAKDCGVNASVKVWDDLWHVFQFFASVLPQSREAIAEIGEFIQLQYGLE